MISKTITLADWEKTILIAVPSIIISIFTVGFFVVQTVYFPNYEQSVFDTFLYVVLSNFMLWMTLKDRYDNSHSDYSGYVFFYLVVIGAVYLLFRQANIFTWNIVILGLIMTYRLAYRLRFGGFPIISFVVNALAMYLLLNQQPINWLLYLYFGLQIFEVYVEKQLQLVFKDFTKRFGPWIFIGYVIYVIIVLVKVYKI